jgi:hypothetical protein
MAWTNEERAAIERELAEMAEARAEREDAYFAEHARLTGIRQPTSAAKVDARATAIRQMAFADERRPLDDAAEDAFYAEYATRTGIRRR